MLFLFESRDDVAPEGVKVNAESELEFILCELASPQSQVTFQMT